MDNKKITLIIFLAFAVICILSNPKEIEHKEAVKSKINQLFQKELANTENTNNQEEDIFAELGKGIGSLFGNVIVDQLVENSVSRKNYLLFSTTAFTFDGESKTIGIGILGNVFLSSKIEKAINEQIDNAL